MKCIAAQGGKQGGVGEISTMAAGATEQLIFAQQFLWQTSTSPWRKGQLSSHKWLCYRHINPRPTPPTSISPPHSSSSPRKSLQRKTIAKMHLGNMWHCRGQAEISCLNVVCMLPPPTVCQTHSQPHFCLSHTFRVVKVEEYFMLSLSPNQFSNHTKKI